MSERNYLREIEQAAFNSFNGEGFEGYEGYEENYEDNYEDNYNYDPNVGMNYDPNTPMNYDEFKGRRRPKAGAASAKILQSPMLRPKGALAQASFDLSITSNFSSAVAPNGLNIQLFAPLYSVAMVQDPSVNNFVPLMAGDASGNIDFLKPPAGAPVPSVLFGSVADKAGNYQICYFSKLGALIWEERNAGVTYQCIVQCQQIPYRSLLNWLQSGSFRINNMRNTYSQADQISSEYQWFKRIWLGSQINNTIQPRNFFSPDQFQSLIVDVRAAANIDKQSGFVYNIRPLAAGAAQNTIQSNIMVSLYTETTL